MSRNWTEQQSNAIGARNGSVLVSAAAGSGKTAVLVQRVIERLTDPIKPTSADRLLIVTFTKLAAGEMRERIMKAVDELLRKDPGNVNLINQQMLLPNAKICTIDSFCASVVKENFELLDISPDFKTVDKSELNVLKKEAVDMTVEQMYKKGDEEFRKIVELLFVGKDDSALEDAVQKLHESAMSFPFPEQWLDGIAQNYDSATEVQESAYGKMILRHVEKTVRYALGLFRYVLDASEGDEVLEKIFHNTVSSDAAQCEYILSTLENGSWDDIRRAVNSYSPENQGDVKGELKEDRFIKHLVGCRAKGKETVRDLAGILPCSSVEYGQDIDFFSGAIRSLVETVKLYGENLKTIKKAKKVADFSDVMHMAISLFVRVTDRGWERTPLAESISESYDEILMDECQDTNSAQNLLFTSISRDNIFRVGDVKQSIYSFRQAMPEIFMGIKDSVEMYDKDKDNYPSKIILGKNFRSRKGVTDIINFIFEQLMNRESGDIEYNEEEKLIYGNTYDEDKECNSEFHLLELKELDISEESTHEYQARYIASQIKKMIAAGYKIKDGNGERKVSYRDFAVLFRAIGNGKGTTYADVFRKEGIACFIEISDSFLTSNEIALVLNLLRIIDNPKQDIPLLSVMMSPVFGFTVDEVALIKKTNRRGSVYSSLVECARRGDAHCKEFLEKISHWRSVSVCFSANELINSIYEETALLSVFDATDKSGAKRANLMLLLDYAITYEKSGYKGLTGFIRFIDKLSSEKQDLSGAVNVCQNADVVRLMTIHKSKGLEFPVCILANSAGTFNRTDESSNLISNRHYGVAMKYRDIDTGEKLGSVPYNAVKLAVHHDSVSEEMRVLYVALTRAREKLIMVYAGKNLANGLINCGVDATGDKIISPAAVEKASSLGKWLLTTLLRHPDAHELRALAGVDEGSILPCESGLKVVIQDLEEKSEALQEDAQPDQPDEAFYELVKQRAEFRYKYEALSGITVKRTASSVDRSTVDNGHFASSRPAFLCEGGLTAAQRGTATHKFIQFADYPSAISDLEGEIERLRLSGMLTDTEAAAINRRTVSGFLRSNLMKRMLASDKVLREKRFIIEVPISEVYDSVEEFSDEKVMIQGACDCAFVEDGELVVVDYKTDRIENPDEFVEKYSSQLMFYKKALAMCTGLKVKQTLLYSFYLSKEIEVL